jgi:hypothetical protein
LIDHRWEIEITKDALEIITRTILGDDIGRSKEIFGHSIVSSIFRITSRQPALIDSRRGIRMCFEDMESNARCFLN